MFISKRSKFIIAILIMIGIWLVMPYHLQKALTYWYPEIDDYEIFENREVHTSNSQFEWPVSENYMKKEISSHWRDTLLLYNTVAYLVIQNDSILYEEYWDGYGTDSYSNSFSMAKSIVSLLIGAAIDDGYINSIDEKAFKYLPHLKDTLSQKLSIRNLLTMSSGSNWDESYSSPLSMTTQAYYGNNLPRLIKHLHVIETPGRTFSYKSGDSQLLAQIIKNSTGKTLSKYASEKLWKPLGAKNEALWSLDRKNGTEKAYCCFNSNARDFALLGELINHEGNWNGQQIISANYIKKATSPADYLVDDDGDNVEYYGYQFWILKHENLSIPYFRGILGQYIFCIPEKNAVIVRLGHERSPYKINHHPSDTYDYIDMGLELLN